MPRCCKIFAALGYWKSSTADGGAVSAVPAAMGVDEVEARAGAPIKAESVPTIPAASSSLRRRDVTDEFLPGVGDCRSAAPHRRNQQDKYRQKIAHEFAVQGTLQRRHYS